MVQMLKLEQDGRFILVSRDLVGRTRFIQQSDVRIARAKALESQLKPGKPIRLILINEGGDEIDREFIFI